MELRRTPTQQLLELKQVITKELNRRSVGKEAERRLLFLQEMTKGFRPPAEEEKAANKLFNKKSLRSLRLRDLQNPPNVRVKYLKPLLAQDWSLLFEPQGSDTSHYVYAHCDPRETPFCGLSNLGGRTPGQPFYVGKGIGSRAWDMKRNQGHGIRLRAILAEGYPHSSIVHIFRRDLTDSAALELEAKLVYFFGTIYEPGRKGILLNLDTCKRPVFFLEMDKIQPHKKRKPTSDTLRTEGE